MNRSIGRVFVVIVLLFGLLIVFTSRWTVFEAEGLRRNSLNKLPLLREQQVPRGSILAGGGSTIARSRQVGEGDDAAFRRSYPSGNLFAHPVGYSYLSGGRAGLEQFYDDQLSGRHNEFRSIADELFGRESEGDDLVTELDRTAQRTAETALAGRAGAVAVMEPSTGRIPVYVSVPGFDPNTLAGSRARQRLYRDKQSPLFDRVSKAGYPPGSTFKIVTASAALDTGRFTPDSVVNGNSPKQISGTALSNSGDRSFGDINLTTALQNSVNTVWAQVAVKLGSDTMFEYMKRFGFNANPPIDLPEDQIAPSGVVDTKTSELLGPGDGVDLGRMAIGQERLLVTPLQMATVAATVANGGLRMAPRLASRFRDRDGRTVSVVKPDKVRRVISQRTASDLTDMMARVVEEGTGQAANLPGVRVAGKTGTAEVGCAAGNQAWFIGFAPIERPRFAIAATVECTEGQGGTVAAPIAATVLRELLK